MNVLITGASGHLGPWLCRAFRRRGAGVTGWSGRQQVNLLDETAVTAALKGAAPDILIHAAGVTSMAAADADPDLARNLNALAPARLTRLCLERRPDCRVIYLSTDMVFDGTRAPYHPDDPCRPLSIYGRTKVEGERLCLEAGAAAVLRLSLLYGFHTAGIPSFFDRMHRALQQGEGLSLFTDEWRTPLAYDDAADMTLDLATGDGRGIFHAGGPERISRYGMGLAMARCLGLDPAPFKKASLRDLADTAPRPADLSLHTRSGTSRSMAESLQYHLNLTSLPD